MRLTFCLKNIFIYIILVSALSNCGKTERVDTRAVKEAIKSREIKKITDAQIVERGLKLGERDVHTFIECYNQSGNKRGFSFLTCFDSVRVKEIKDVKIILPDSGSLNLLGKELELLEAYKYNFEHDEPPINNLQDLKNGSLLYTYPVYRNISDKVLYEKLKAGTKPESFAIIFIYFDKRQVILNM